MIISNKILGLRQSSKKNFEIECNIVQLVSQNIHKLSIRYPVRTKKYGIFGKNKGG